MTPLILLCQIVLVGAVVAFVLARRWHVTPDDHPHCRRCGFDLFGRGEDAGACPECGADVSDPKAIRRGQSRIRPRVLAAGLLLLVVGVGLGVSSWVRDAGVNVARYKPMWLLRWESDSTNPVRALPAIEEMVGRFASGGMSRDDRRELVQFALDRQATAVTPAGAASPLWTPRLAEVLEAGVVTGDVSDAEYRRYLEQGLTPLVQWRPAIGSGQPLPVRVALRPRTASLNPIEVAYELALERFGDLEPAMSPLKGWEPGGRLMRRRWMRDETHLIDFATIAGTASEASSGEQSLRWRLDVTVRDPVGGTVVHRWSRTLEGAVEVVAGNAPRVTLKSDPAQAVEMQAGMSFHLVNMVAGNGKLGIAVVGEALPRNVAARAVVRHQGREIDAGDVVLRQGPRDMAVLRDVIDGAQPGDAIELLLEPDARVAERTADIAEAWGDPIVLPLSQAMPPLGPRRNPTP